MKKLFYALVFLCVVASSSYAAVNINAANFPDPTFRNYVTASFDINRNGTLDDEELSNAGWVDVHGMGISSLQGIEYFTALEALDCSNNNLTALDLSRNVNLRDIQCQTNNLTALNFSNNSRLEHVSCGENLITALDLSNKTNLKEIYCPVHYPTSENDPEPEDSSGGTLTSLNITNTPALESIWIDGQPVTALDLRNKPVLKSIHTISCNLINELNLSECPLLEDLLCCRNNISSLNVRSNTELISLDVAGCNLTTMDVSNNRKLEYLVYNETPLTSANVTNNPALRDLRFWRTNIVSLDVRNCTELRLLHCSDSNLETLIMGSHPYLEELACGESNLTSLDVSGCPALKNLDCGNAELETLNVTGCTALISLDCYSHNLHSLNVSNNRNLRYLSCGDGYIESLDVSNCPELVYLDCGWSLLTTLDVTRNTKLEFLECTVGNIKALDLSNNPELRILYCEVNSIKGLDLSKNTRLEELYCNKNQIAAIDLSANTSINPDEISVRKQKIRSLNVNFNNADENNTYPYTLNLLNYLNGSYDVRAAADEDLAELLNNVVSSSIRAVNDEGSEITHTYSNGIIRMTEFPAKVMYSYRTGYGDLIMDVSITSGDEDPFSITLNNHLYRVLNAERMTWPEAKAYCESLGGHLATISGDEERDTIEEMLSELRLLNNNASGFYSSPFLGAEKVDDKWQWIDGSEFDEGIFWSEGNKSGTYLRITYSGRIRGSTADSRRAFICEWDQISVDVAPLAEEFEIYSNDPEAYLASIDFHGDLPDPVDLSHLADNLPVFDTDTVSASLFRAAALPAKYDLRNYGRVSSIKNQNPYGTCWAFSALSSLESSYLTQHSTLTAPDLSELHLAWYAFRDSRKGYSFPLNDSKEKVLDQGGWPSMAIALLARLSAPASETALPYTSANNVSSLTSGKLPESYSMPIRLKEAYTIGKINSSNRDIVKNLIMQYGAVQITYNHNDGQIVKSAYYYPSSQGSGHAVNIIGWDDDYSVNEFTKSKPNAKGAWLIKNSWGTSALSHDEGCFWMSYEQNIGDSALYIAGDVTSGMKQYGYDELGSPNSVSIGKNYNNQWAANIFRTSAKEQLREVAFYTKDNNTPYEIYINKLGTVRPSNPGRPVTRYASGTIPMAGYHTVTLRTPVELDENEYFSVMLKIGQAKGSNYQHVMAVEGHYRSGGVRVNAGESYFAGTSSPVSSDWTDGMSIKNGPFNACIKAFTVASTVTPAPTPSTPQDDNETEGSNDGGSGGGGCDVGITLAGLAVISFMMKKR